MTRVLIIEDDVDLAMGLRANLEIEGYEVTCEHSGEDGVRAALADPPQLVILDLMLPQMDGYDVLAQLRDAALHMPVLLLSARSQELDKVRGFRAGADDYVTKPFGLMELLLRVRALLKRSAPAGMPAAAGRGYQIGGARVDVESRTVRRGAHEVSLSPKAFDLLNALYERRDKIVSRHDLLREVWRYNESVTTRTVDAHIVELRRKLEDDPANPQYILTARKVGYRLRV
ncbi:MAG: response regulator transcription factor [Gemmatimonadaceae bacterium]|nr:response regulator transcription factor [Gemmatimonadaceae bacterium]